MWCSKILLATDSSRISTVPLFCWLPWQQSSTRCCWQNCRLQQQSLTLAGLCSVLDISEKLTVGVFSCIWLSVLFKGISKGWKRECLKYVGIVGYSGSGYRSINAYISLFLLMCVCLHMVRFARQKLKGMQRCNTFYVRRNENMISSWFSWLKKSVKWEVVQLLNGVSGKKITEFLSNCWLLINLYVEWWLKCFLWPKMTDQFES